MFYQQQAVVFLSHHFSAVIGTHVGIASASLNLAFSLSTGTEKKLLKTTRDKKKNHNKIIMLARSKLNSIEGKVSESSINNEISHKDFLTIVNAERNYRELKPRVKSINPRVPKTTYGKTMVL